MGIESEQLVFDYLSRVGDLAHGTSMTAADRARLVSGLRAEIDRVRAAEGGAESRSAVRRILDRFGSPQDVVTAAAGGESVSWPRPGTAGEDGAPDGRARRLTKLPQMRKRQDVPEPPVQRGASPPHLAGIDELGPDESDPDWWRTGGGPFGGGGRRDHSRELGYDIPDAFSGGVELPEVFRRPPDEEDGPGGRKAPAAPAAPGGTVVKAAAAGAAGSGLGLLLARRRAGAAAGPRAGGAVELLAAAVLVAGAVMGSPVPLALGWLAAFWSPRLTRPEAKWAALGVPALTGGGALVWVWGRTEGRWGAPLAEGDAMRGALSDMGPGVLRVAAVASALYLVWRARRPK